MNSHFDRHFDDELNTLKQQILQMGDLVELQVINSLKALCDHDMSIMEATADNEKTVNRMQIDIDEYCLRLIALHQPTAIDLRFLMGVSKINNELERVADHSYNIYQHVAKIMEFDQLKPYIDIPIMAAKTREMFKDSLRAFVDLDVEKAREILLQDDQVDILRYKIIDECIDIIKSDPESARIAVYIIMLVNNIEKIADHATNIAEIVIFVAQGKDVRHHIENERD